MKRLILLIYTLIFIGIMAACSLPIRYTQVRGNGNVITDTRDVSNFDSVELSGIGRLEIVQDGTESLKIEAEENLLPYLKSMVSGGILRLGLDEFVNIQPQEDIVYYLTVKNLDSIKTSGLASVGVDELQANNLRIDISGGGNVVISELAASRLTVDVSGVGNVEMGGTVDRQRIDISGAGNFLAGDLKSQKVDLEISGTGRAVLWVAEELNASLSGAGSIQYYGDPDVQSDISGVGELKPLGSK